MSLVLDVGDAAMAAAAPVGFFRSARKAAAKATGMHGAFSGKRKG